MEIDYKKLSEKIFIRRMITEVYPTGVVSLVSDTFDFWRVVTEIALELKEEILARQPNAIGLAKVVFRPDSGDPVDIVAGLPYVTLPDDIVFDCLHTESLVADHTIALYKGKFRKIEVDYEYGYDGDSWFEGLRLEEEIPAHIVKGAVECLWDIFGGDTNEKGFRTLNQRVGLIYGDSITLARAEAILSRLAAKGFSAGNIVFGIGSYTYQYITRDTFGMAIKATYGVVNGEARELFKDPKTGDGIKKSAKGLLRVEEEDGKFVLYDQQTLRQEGEGALTTVFYNSELTYPQSLSDIRARLK